MNWLRTFLPYLALFSLVLSAGEIRAQVSSPFDGPIDAEESKDANRSRSTSQKKKASKKRKSGRKRRRKKSRGQSAIVAIEGAAVYKFANFDSPVLEYLKAGTKLIATIKPRPGIGGFGAFYKVKLPNKKIGWMADTDVLPQYKLSKSGKAVKGKNPDFKKAENIMDNVDRDPIYFQKYIGVNLGLVQFSEKFENKTLSTNATMFGLHAVGPGLLGDSPPLDFSLAFSLEAPDYYGDFASQEATGFFLIGDALFPFPFIAADNFSVTLGMGPMFSYTNFAVRVRSSDFDSQELRIGGVVSLGAMARVGSVGFKIDSKYYYEVTQYTGFHFSLLFNIK